MKNVPSEVIDTIRETARSKGSSYLMSYQMFQNGSAAVISEGLISITPGLSLEEAFRKAAMSSDLEGRFLVVTEMFDLAANKIMEGYPVTIQGADKPKAGLN